MMVDVVGANLISRTEFLAALQAAQVRFDEIDLIGERTERRRSGMAVVVGQTEMRGRAQNLPFAVSSRYTHLFVAEAGGWRLLSAQGTRMLPQEATIPKAGPVPAYVVSEVEVLDEPLAQRYRELAAASIAAYGGRYVVRGARPVAVEGEWPSVRRLVIAQFPSTDRLHRWYGSAEYAEALSVRPKALDRRLLFAEGLPPQGA